jgi:hypothetical protein
MANYNISPAITLPRIDIPFDAEREAKETAALVLERRTIREGMDAWCDLSRANSFESWKRIGQALSIGKQRALKLTGSNRAWGQNYSREFGIWLKEHQFDRMPGPTRSVAITLAEHEAEITAWRNGLPEKQRRRLINPQSVVKRWRASQPPSDPAPEIRSRPSDTPVATDLRRNAETAWHSFVSALAALPPSEAAPLKATAIEFLRDGAAFQC